MKTFKIFTLALAALVVVSCGTATKNGTLIGAGGGALLGAVVGKLAGNTAVGAAVGGAVGAGAGALIGKKMDNAKKRAEAIKNAQVESVTDANGLAAVKVTFESGILFPSSSSTLQATAKTSLTQFADEVLKANTDMDVAIQGYSDNDAWKNSTAEQSQQKNLELSQKRAQSVSDYLKSLGVSTSQIKSVDGFGEANPVASNDTKEGKAQNRRVEVYLYASKAMIEAAENGTLQ